MSAYLQVATRNLLRGTAKVNPDEWGAPRVDLVGYQENDPKVVRARLAGKNSSLTVTEGEGPASAIPVAYNAAKLRKMWSSDQLTHKGIAHVSPNRYNHVEPFAVAGARRPLVIVNKHMISAAWTRHPWRKGLWWLDYWKTAAILRWAISMDYHIVLTGDLNRNVKRTGGRLWPKYLRVAHHNGYYDYVLYRAAKSERMTVKGGWNGQKAGSDHTPSIAAFTIGA